MARAASRHQSALLKSLMPFAPSVRDICLLPKGHSLQINSSPQIPQISSRPQLQAKEHRAALRAVPFRVCAKVGFPGIEAQCRGLDDRRRNVFANLPAAIENQIEQFRSLDLFSFLGNRSSPDYSSIGVLEYKLLQ